MVVCALHHKNVLYEKNCVVGVKDVHWWWCGRWTDTSCAWGVLLKGGADTGAMIVLFRIRNRCWKASVHMGWGVLR
jgi:hypothetical protein